ncbi:MAG: hypothetical protein AABN33_07070 [Acidobacteriota bacterium]
MNKYRFAERKEAIRRGLNSIYRTACDPDNFEEYGYDYLCCFLTIAETSLDPKLRQKSRRMGRERALEWLRQNAKLPRRTDMMTLLTLLMGSGAAERLGVRDEWLREQICKRVRRLTARDCYEFDPVIEAPPDDIPEACDCGAGNERGRTRCRKCRRKLAMTGRYGAWLDAVIWSYTGERYGAKVGSRYWDAIKWLPAMRPYRGREDGANPDFYNTVYAITHVVYTLNDYNAYTLSPKWLPEEFRFLKNNLKEAIAEDDPDMMGEFLDTLRAFGLKDSHPVIRKGMDYLLSHQNSDGSWGDVNAENIYLRHHPTWTAIDGLRAYRWQGPRLGFPELEPLLKTWAAKEGERVVNRLKPLPSAALPHGLFKR